MESLRAALEIFTFLFLALVVASQADVEAYWKSKLPNSRMPKAVRDLLHNEWSEEKSAANTMVGGSPNPFVYKYAASEEQLRSDPSVALFFLRKDLRSGKTMTLHFTTSPRTSGFLPRKAADSIPFSSDSLDTVLNRFQLEPNSSEARAMKTTVEECEEAAVKGEHKYCATSLEAMLDFSTSKLGENVDAISTEVRNHKLPQEYEIVDVKKINGGGGDEAVVCHRQKYAYAVFYCHGSKLATEAYAVYLAGADGTKAKAAAVCHKDTAAWNPNHLAFQLLKVEPGSVTICHFLPQDHILWVAK